MEITKRKLKQIIREEMQNLAETGDITMITEAEHRVFKVVLGKLSSKELEKYGLQRI